MQKETKSAILEFGGAVLLIVLVIGGLLFITREKPPVDETLTDGAKFKEEYEALNGTSRQSDGAKYNTVSVDEDNPIKYITPSEAVDILDSKTGIIYVGAPWCPWCRNAVPVLFELAKKRNVETIYYVELDDVKSNYEVKDGLLVKTSEGTEDYYRLLDKLSDRLEDYKITSDGKTYDTGEKRIYMPYVISVKDGKVVGDKVGTVSLDKDQTKYDEFTDEQHKKLLETYGELFDLAFGEDGSCDGDSCE